jgi:hypothetical protein
MKIMKVTIENLLTLPPGYYFFKPKDNRFDTSIFRRSILGKFLVYGDSEPLDIEWLEHHSEEASEVVFPEWLPKGK